MPVVRLARTVAVVLVVVVDITAAMVVITAVIVVGICSVVEKISVKPPTPSNISVDISSFSVANISPINPVTFSSLPVMFLARALDRI